MTHLQCIYHFKILHRPSYFHQAAPSPPTWGPGWEGRKGGEWEGDRGQGGRQRGRSESRQGGGKGGKEEGRAVREDPSCYSFMTFMNIGTAENFSLDLL